MKLIIYLFMFLNLFSSLQTYKISFVDSWMVSTLCWHFVKQHALVWMFL